MLIKEYQLTPRQIEALRRGQIVESVVFIECISETKDEYNQSIFKVSTHIPG